MTEIMTEDSNTASEYSESLCGLPYKQSIAVTLLAEGRSKVEVAQTLSVSDRQVRRWAKNPKFSDLLTKALESQFRQRLAKISNRMDDILDSMIQMCMSPRTPARERVKIFEILFLNQFEYLRYKDGTEYQRRIISLEHSLNVELNQIFDDGGDPINEPTTVSSEVVPET